MLGLSRCIMSDDESGMLDDNASAGFDDFDDNASAGWERSVLPPVDLTEFLRNIKLPHLDQKLVELGYDDVDDFQNFKEADRERMRLELVKADVPVGHANKLVRAVAGRAALPQHISSGSMPATPAAAVSAGAYSVGIAAAAMQYDAHKARVRKLIDDQECLNPGSPRLIFGRGNTAAIKSYEEAVNAAALRLLEANPRLISFSCGRIQTQPLINAAKVSPT